MLEHLRELGKTSKDPAIQAVGKMAEAGLIVRSGKDIPFPSPAAARVEIPAQRNLEDMLALFGCSKDQIAKSPDEINDNTKAYVGSLVHRDNNGAIIPIFKKIGHLEHIYTSYPEGRIRGETISIGGKTPKELQEELQKGKVNVSKSAEDMIKSKDFTTLKKPKNITILRLKVQYLELEGIPTTDKVYGRGEALGLDKCPAEVGPHKRLKDTDQPLGDLYFIAMKQITDRGGYPSVFRLARGGHGLWLGDGWANSTLKWNPDNGLVFSLSKGS